jgi:thymidylate kinase
MTPLSTVVGSGRRARSGAVVVSFSGLDGAGKTRQITALQEHLDALGLASRVEWVPFRIWPETLLNRLPAGFRARLGPKRRSGAGTDAPVLPGDGSAPRPSVASRLLRLAWTAVGSLAAVSAGLSLRRRFSSVDAPVVILDRYRLDSAVKLRFWYADVSPALLLRVVTALAPAPHLELLLRVRPEVAYARKPEQWSPRQLARQAASYDELAARVAAVVLDGEGDPEQIQAEVARRVRAVLDAR